LSFVWGSAEANIEGAAGGFAIADGYHVMQFAGVGTDYPVLNEIREMYRSRARKRRRRWRRRCSITGRAGRGAASRGHPAAR
jgi:hypothetical protein